jgi:hypothetical protein
MGHDSVLVAKKRNREIVEGIQTLGRTGAGCSIRLLGAKDSPYKSTSGVQVQKSVEMEITDVLETQIRCHSFYFIDRIG